MLLPLTAYDRIIVSFSGGKDSAACVLHLLDLGASNKLTLYHQCVDGEPGSKGLMDWPCTEGYVKAFAQALNLPLQMQWKIGGFEREMLRTQSLTQPVQFQQEDGQVSQAGGKRGKLTTRRRFPQVSADLRVRWCSSYLKIDVAAMAINNDPALKNKKILFITGERREESTARSKYLEYEEHRCHSKKRLVHHWRPIIDWSEAKVWQILEKHQITAHPAYHIGFSRVSCMACIFGNPDQWASVKELDPGRFHRIALYEGEFQSTIKKGRSVVSQATAGQPYEQLALTKWRNLAMQQDFPVSAMRSDPWEMPGGAFRHCGGPT